MNKRSCKTQSEIDPRIVEFAGLFLKYDRELDAQERELTNGYASLVGFDTSAKMEVVKAHRIGALEKVCTVLAQRGIPMARFEQALSSAGASSLDIRRFWETVGMEETQRKQRSSAERLFMQAADSFLGAHLKGVFTPSKVSTLEPQAIETLPPQRLAASKKRDKVEKAVRHTAQAAPVITP
ncbi:MAG: hypothetical protein PW734_01105 [Verrucomicrobium sp.]|nr:hypothetical protein [Verrucomicrobium sp.]